MRKLILSIAGTFGILSAVGCHYDSGCYDPCSGRIAGDRWEFASQRDYGEYSHHSRSGCHDCCESCCDDGCDDSCGSNPLGWLSDKFNEPLEYSDYGEYAYSGSDYRHHHSRRWDNRRHRGYRRFGHRRHCCPGFDEPGWNQPMQEISPPTQMVPTPVLPPQPASGFQLQPAPAVQQTSYEYESGSSNYSFQAPVTKLSNNSSLQRWRPTRSLSR